MDIHGIAIVLDEIATLLEIEGANRFKARAFANAARALERADGDIGGVSRAGLESIDGIGKSTAAVIRELMETGASRYYADLRQRTPRGLLELLAVPGLGAGRVRELHGRLGVATLDDLERAAREGRVAALSGFGARTQARVLEGIAHVRESAGRRRYADALELATRLRAFAAGLPGVQEVEIAGELRRACETVAGVVLVVSATDRPAVATKLAALPGLDVDEDDVVVGRLADGLGVRVRIVAPESFATTLLFETGSDVHVTRIVERAAARGMRVEASALFDGAERRAVHAEADVYAALDLPPIAPELRETGEELVAADDGVLPALVAYDDLRGCFHCHTTWSDGRASVAEMAEAARARGWRYLGIADHSKYAGYAGGLSPDEILAQHDEIDAWNDAHGQSVWLFKGIEADILPDGELDYGDRPDLLARFDYVVASMHSGFQKTEDEQTRRFLTVLGNPYVTFLGHLTGRRLLARPGVKLDMPTVLEAVARRGIGIEINGDPNRMDMDWRHWRAAKALGIRTALNPDAHSVAQLGYVDNAVAMARKGWLESGDVVNCDDVDDVRRFFAASRRA